MIDENDIDVAWVLLAYTYTHCILEISTRIEDDFDCMLGACFLLMLDEGAMTNLWDLSFASSVDHVLINLSQFCDMEKIVCILQV
jgi:hypothetical protein